MVDSTALPEACGEPTGPAVALIIVNYNSGELLRRCLAAVHAQDRPADRVIVVDNASSDGSLETASAELAGVQLLRLDYNSGFAVANNRALTLCGDCRWVALLNPDAFPHPGWLAALLAAAAERPDAGSFASCLVTDAAAGRLDGIGDAYHVSGLVWRLGHGQSPEPAREPREVFSACAAAALYRVDALKRIGGFDEAYFCYNEDVDVGFRLRLGGLSCWYVPDAVAQHVGSAVTGRHSDFSLFHGHRNLVWTWVKNMPTGLLRRFLWQHLLMNLVAVTVLSVRYRTTAVIRSKISALRGLRRVLRQRRDVQAQSSATEAQLLAVMTRSCRRDGIPEPGKSR